MRCENLGRPVWLRELDDIVEEEEQHNVRRAMSFTLDERVQWEGWCFEPYEELDRYPMPGDITFTCSCGFESDNRFDIIRHLMENDAISDDLIEHTREIYPELFDDDGEPLVQNDGRAENIEEVR